VTLPAGATLAPISRRNPDGSPVHVVLVVRVSHPSAWDSLSINLAESLMLVAGLDGAEEIAGMGIGPLQRPDNFKDLDHDFARQGNKRTVVYGRGQITVVLSLGSAAELDEAKENLFTTMCARTIREVRPDHIVTVSLSRMVRSSYLASEIYRAIIDANVKSLVTRSNNGIDFTSPMSEVLWPLLVWIVSWEREENQIKMLRARIRRALRGEWVTSKRGLVPGWRFGADGKPEVDPDQVELVREVVQRIGNPDMPIALTVHWIKEVLLPRRQQVPVVTDG
jgi:hypothetical protein